MFEINFLSMGNLEHTEETIKLEQHSNPGYITRKKASRNKLFCTDTRALAFQGFNPNTIIKPKIPS